jgi:hypothetical protein
MKDKIKTALGITTIVWLIFAAPILKSIPPGIVHDTVFIVGTFSSAIGLCWYLGLWDSRSRSELARDASDWESKYKSLKKDYEKLDWHDRGACEVAIRRRASLIAHGLDPLDEKPREGD